jgi:hypothetical protein
MNERQQRAFIHFLAKELKNYVRELMAYQLFAHFLKESGMVENVDDLLRASRQSPLLEERFQTQFEGFDAILPPQDSGYEDQVKELLLKWRPPEGPPN